MSDEFPFRQKRFSHSIYVLAQSVSSLSSSKNVFHILRILQHMVFRHFSRQKMFITFHATLSSW